MDGPKIIPFPSSRLTHFIRRHASIMAGLSPAAGERHLQRQLKIKADTMARRSIHADLIADDQKKLENAIRADLCRIGVLRGGVG